MTEKQFRLRDYIDKDIQCEEIEYNGKWITYGLLVDFLNNTNEENKYLKSCELYKKNQQLIKMLDNVANYMQKQHEDMPIDDFVEWWNEIATEGLK